MWRETNLFGVLLPPILGYIAVALVLLVPVRAVLFRWRWVLRIGNPALVQASLFMVILATLISVL